MAQSLPTGGTVVGGNVAIGSTSPTSLTISQSSRTGIVNWSSFSVGQGNQVQFNNGSGATLNRVTGNVPSSINGVVSATGSVYLVNPSGVVVGPTGMIKTGGSFVASTLDVKDADFRAGGALTFSGNSNASVVNLGKIGSSKGDVVLIARQVRNDGSLTARGGTAAMASGSEVLLSDGSLGNGKVLVRRPAQDGEIRNSGAIRATEVELRANGGNIYALAGNIGGAISATGVASKGGRVFLTSEGGSVNVTQKVVARRIQADAPTAPVRSGGERAFTGGDVVVSGDKVMVGGAIVAKGSNGAGGTAVVTGRDVTLTSGAKIDASGTSGGTVLIGGDRAGGSDAARKFLPQAIANAQNATIEAGATIMADGTSGAGGNVVVWSDGATSFGGAISATGLRGGFIETSGHAFDFAGGSVNAGPGGTWLLDPVDLTINSTLAATIASALNGNSNVTQETNAAGSGGSGDITVASGISWSTSATLTLSAYRNIAVNANITSTGGGGLVLRADNAGTGTGTVTFGGGQVSTAGAVSIYYNPTGSNSTVNATKYTAPTQTNFSGNVTGGATLKTNMLVNTVFDLQNMKNNLAGAYALSRDIDASITSTWNSGAGFQPIGGSNSFTGNLDGQGHTISGLFINRPSDQYVGLVGYLAAGSMVSNVGIIDASVTGGTTVGAIVGGNYGTVSNVYSSGSVTAISAGAGGLVGYNFYSLSNGYSNSTVRGPLYVGGAVGLNNCANPCVNFPGVVSQVYATGAVIGTGTGPTSIGGLVGFNGSTVTASYWDSYTSGQTLAIGSGSGSATAVTSDPAQSAAANYAFKQSAYGGFSFPGTGSTGWYMVDGQTRPFGRWEYQTTITNAHQLQLMAMNLGASYTLAGNIDLSSSLAAVNGKYPGMWTSAGFSPIGSTASKFTGAFNGQGYTIANLTINRSTTDDVGLFGYVGTGVTVQDVGLLGAAVTGKAEVGALAGNNAGTITRSYATGVVNGSGNDVGGLVGRNTGTGSNITQSYAGVTVGGSSNPNVGGLVGFNDGTITRSYATGAVSGTGNNVGGLVGISTSTGNITQSYASGTVGGANSYVGGLVGINEGTITESYAVGAVNGGSEVGGLAGGNAKAITRSYSTGAVNGSGSDVGGLVGKNVGTGSSITQSYASGTVGTPNFFVGGLVGNNEGTIAQAYAVGTVTGQYVGGLAGNNSGSITQAYAAGAVSGTAPGGLIGNNGGTISQSYFDTVTTGQNAAIGNGSVNGGIGLTTSQMQNPANYATTYTGWDFTNVWSAPSAGYYPQLYGVNYVLRVEPANASRVYGDANPAFTYTTTYGLHTGDTSAILSGLSLSTAATATSNIGSYAITAGGSVISATGQAYRLIQTPATLTVTPRAITVTADARSRVYGDANPALTYQVGGSGLVNGDTLSGALATSATTASNVGTYGITQGTLAASSNYTLSSFTGDNLTVTPRTITVTADAKSRAYGDANPPLTYLVGGSGLVNGDTLSGALATSATTASNAGVYGITQGTLAASTNYTLSSFTGANLTVTPRAITVTADTKSRAYGDANPALTYLVGGAGLVNGDTLSGALVTSAATSSNVGTYGIGQGTLAASG
ncbi:MBG domain-containing protein, partial [Bradyrhizobium jicamae]|uniref:MBG domain-containing protein n=1 Tax=Bradyrhizobium jicamae TaxID=280332 RepID=UPI0018DEC9F5